MGLTTTPAPCPRRPRDIRGQNGARTSLATARSPLPTLYPSAKLAVVGLDHFASCLPSSWKKRRALRDRLLDLLLTRQLERTDERRVQTILKLSGLPSGKTIEYFDWSF